MNDRSGKIYCHQGDTFGRETYFVHSLDAAFTLAVLSDIEDYDIYKNSIRYAVRNIDTQT